MAEVFTQDLVSNLMSGERGAFDQSSVFSCCLLPLLKALDSKLKAHEIAESLPHYSFTFDLVALKSILFQLDYSVEEVSIKINDIDHFDLPCLYIDNSGKVYVITHKIENVFTYFDAQEKTTKESVLEECSGKAYFFYHSRNEIKTKGIKDDWFVRVIKKFYPIFKNLLVISFFLNMTTLCIPLFIMAVYDIVIGSKNTDPLFAFSIGILAVMSLDLLLRILRSKLIAFPAGQLEYILGTTTLQKILHLPSSMTENSPVAAQLSKLRLYDSIREFFTGHVALLIIESPFIPIFIIVIAWLGGGIAIIPIAVLVIFFLIGVVFVPRLKKYIHFSAEMNTEKEQLLMETLSGVLEIKTMSEEEGWLRRFKEVSAKATSANLKASQIQSLLHVSTQFITSLAAIAIVGFGSYQAIQGALSIGALVAIMAILWRVIGPLQSLLMAYIQFDQITDGIRGINELMALKPERTANRSALLRPSFNGDIKFERASFRYGAHLDPVLVGASFHIKAKETVVVVGGNGSGKSTILKLLCGMYYAQAGNILIDDTEVRQLNAKALRRMIAYVPQHPRLFHGTISQNLRFKDILASDDDLKSAAKEAGVLEAIERLPQGFDTYIGDKATDGLPSGLQSGLCIARAFVKNAPIVLLDEPGASQNKDSLSHLIRQLGMLKGKKTIVMTSHLPQLIKICDKVILMDKGFVKKVMTPQQYLAEGVSL